VVSDAESTSSARSADAAGNGVTGAALWDFIQRFVAARSTFLSIYRRYERRVLRAARSLGVNRNSLVLPPHSLFRLFHLQRMQLLRDYRLRPLRDLAQRTFGDSSDEELLDVYCSHIYHEFTILSEEHRSVGRFLRIDDKRRYRQLFEEVSGYYPMRLRRIRRLFTGGLRRIEVLLPTWSRGLPRGGPVVPVLRVPRARPGGDRPRPRGRPPARDTTPARTRRAGSA
jgi:hypothetical protein